MFEYKLIRQLENEGKFILDYCSWVPECCCESPPRFDGTVSTQPFQPEKCFLIQGRILPNTEPYYMASFLIQLTIPHKFPFEIPKVFFIDSVYHPDIQYDR